jgi:aspartate aminotransferase
MSRQWLAARVGALRPTAINRVLADVRRCQAKGKTIISLMRGQPDTPTPEPIVAAAVQSLRTGRTGYPDNRGEPECRRAIAEKLRRDNGLTYDPDREILVTDGATAALWSALAALTDSGDDVLLPDPVYDAYGPAIALGGARPVSVSSQIRNGRFTLEVAALERAWTPRAKVLLLNTPWNPTGTVLTREELAALLDFAEAHDLVVLSDEIYEVLIYDARRHVSPAALSEAARRRIVTINSLSKTYAMTGWRVGYAAAPAPVIEAMLLVLQQFSRGPATFVQDAAACALRGDQTCVREMAAEYQARRDFLLQQLRDIAGIAPLLPEGGLFVMVDVRPLGLPSDEVRRFLLEEAGVAVVHGSAYGPGGEGTLRVSFAAGGQTLHEGAARLRHGLLRLAAGEGRKGSG